MTMTMSMTSLLLLEVLLLMVAAPLPISHCSHINAAMAAAATDNDIPWAASRNQQNNIEVAIEEMQRANYFTFVMLIKMAPPDLMILGGNVTFLMPNDKTLSQNNTIIPPAPGNDMINSVSDFLLLHSIPSPLLLEHLQHFPTGSMVPTSKPDLLLRVTNDGRRRFFLNNVRIISPNICTRESSITCHGIDGVVQALAADCPNTGGNSGTRSPPAQAAPPPAPSLPPASGGSFNTPTDNNSTTSSSTAPPPGGTDISKNSSAYLQVSFFGISEFLTTCLVMMLVLNFSI